MRGRSRTLLTNRTETLYASCVLTNKELMRESGIMGLGAVYTEAGDPVDVVKLIDVDEPRDPGPGQVLVRVTLFPIHWGDLQAIQLASPTGQTRAGVEATGVVEKVGAGVHHVTPGT